MNPFAAATDVVKQVLTLSAAFITLTVTFSKDILPPGASGTRWLLGLAWICHFVSIIAGIVAMMKIAGLQAVLPATLQPASKNDQAGQSGQAGIWDPFLRNVSGVQLAAFALGMTLLFALGLTLVICGKPAGT